MQFSKPRVVVLNWGWFCSPEDTGHVRGHFGCHIGRRGAPGIWWAEAGDAAECPAMHTTAQLQRKMVSQVQWCRETLLHSLALFYTQTQSFLQDCNMHWTFLEWNACKSMELDEESSSFQKITSLSTKAFVLWAANPMPYVHASVRWGSSHINRDGPSTHQHTPLHRGSSVVRPTHLPTDMHAFLFIINRFLFIASSSNI